MLSSVSAPSFELLIRCNDSSPHGPLVCPCIVSLTFSKGSDPGSITIFKNGERLGVAYSNVTGELRPCVDLFDYGDAVRMLKTSGRPF
jgi:hypothetical protein